MPKRLTAFAIDLAILFALLAPLQMLIDKLFGVSVLRADIEGFGLEGMALITLSLPTWLYFIYFEGSKWQATPGKMVLRLMVTDDDGHRLRARRAVLRTFVKMFPLEAAYLTYFIPSPWFTAYGRGEFRFGAILVVGMALVYLLITTWNEQHQSMHDLIAESLVVERQRAERLF